MQRWELLDFQACGPCGAQLDLALGHRARGTGGCEIRESRHVSGHPRPDRSCDDSRCAGFRLRTVSGLRLGAERLRRLEDCLSSHHGPVLPPRLRDPIGKEPVHRPRSFSQQLRRICPLLEPGIFIPGPFPRQHHLRVCPQRRITLLTAIHTPASRPASTNGQCPQPGPGSQPCLWLVARPARALPRLGLSGSGNLVRMLDQLRRRDNAFRWCRPFAWRLAPKGTATVRLLLRWQRRDPTAEAAGSFSYSLCSELHTKTVA
jgi:hypothetical protein